MLVTDFDRSRGNACELCPAPVVQGQNVLTCAGCSNRRVHEYCVSYVLESTPTDGWWCCSNCRDGRPKRPMDPNMSLRTGSARARKAPDTYQVIDTRVSTDLLAPSKRRRGTTPPIGGISTMGVTLSGSQGRSDTPMSISSSLSVASDPRITPELQSEYASGGVASSQGSVKGLANREAAEEGSQLSAPTPTPSTPTTDDTAVTGSSQEAASSKKKRTDHTHVERSRSPILTRSQKRSKSNDLATSEELST